MCVLEVPLEVKGIEVLPRPRTRGMCFRKVIFLFLLIWLRYGGTLVETKWSQPSSLRHSPWHPPPHQETPVISRVTQGAGGMVLPPGKSTHPSPGPHRMMQPLGKSIYSLQGPHRLTQPMGKTIHPSQEPQRIMESFRQSIIPSPGPHRITQSFRQTVHPMPGAHRKKQPFRQSIHSSQGSNRLFQSLGDTAQPHPHRLQPTTSKPSLFSSIASFLDPFGIIWGTEKKGSTEPQGHHEYINQNYAQGGFRRDSGGYMNAQASFGHNLDSFKRKGLPVGASGDFRRTNDVGKGDTTPTTEAPPPFVYFPDGGAGQCQDFAPSGFNTYSFLSFLFSVANLVGHVANNVNNNLNNNNNNNNDNNNNLDNINSANSNSNLNNENTVDIPPTRKRREVLDEIMPQYLEQLQMKEEDTMAALVAMDFIKGLKTALLTPDPSCALRNMCEVNKNAIGRGQLADVLAEVLTDALVEWYPRQPAPAKALRLLKAGGEGRRGDDCSATYHQCPEAAWQNLTTFLDLARDFETHVYPRGTLKKDAADELYPSKPTPKDDNNIITSTTNSKQKGEVNVHPSSLLNSSLSR